MLSIAEQTGMIDLESPSMTLSLFGSSPSVIVMAQHAIFVDSKSHGDVTCVGPRSSGLSPAAGPT
jgi:hypothetical protein